MYNYQKSLNAIEEILSSPTRIEERAAIPTNEYEYSDTKGIKTWVGCIFVDISDSHHLFAKANENTIRIMRSYSSQVAEILNDDPNAYEIGIRDDCVYCIYNISKPEDLGELLNHACNVNSFMKMFNQVLENHGLEPLTVGIGIGCDYELIVKIGDAGAGINQRRTNDKSWNTKVWNDKVWIGNAIGHASYLSNIANRNGHLPIAMSDIYYDNTIKVLLKETPRINEWIKPFKVNNQVEFYEANLITIEFNQWIEENVPKK